MTSPISVAVIGAGLAGRSHAAAYLNAGTLWGPDLPPIRRAAIVDSNPDLGRDTARRYGFERHLSSVEELCDDPSIDAVSIVVGNDLHRPFAEALVAAGKHVLCEKPLAGSLEDARAMAELERHTDRVTAIGYTYRRVAAVAAIRARLASGSLGPLSVVDGRYWCDYSCDPEGPLTWRYLGAPGSGALADLGIHLIDLVEHVTGSRIVSVSGGSLVTAVPTRPLPLGTVVGHGRAAVSEERGEVTNEDTASFVARFDDGTAATLSCSRTAFGMPNGLSFALHGTGGSAAFDWHRPAEYIYDGPSGDAPAGRRQVVVGPADPYFAGGYPMQAPGNGAGNAESFAYQARAFLDQVAGIRGEVEPCATFADGLHTLEVVDAVVHSHAAGGDAVDVAA
ncbi:Gfo/Idh/MocA family protein [Mobilicoccus pelagius]|uniref:Putative oxidoreductase n=1 Tax=Mobilicoccus pelagius NBRC 104925 TaxID=1089455 RepID=H5USV7_9MICO|nr:Gfo/Idh/MocA family oxidoreductase [Mobilicoccus pelagius]GAB48815.1 putative oxidoreductase [Mobilicoccus pelagius NBRC 104925]